MDVYRFDASKSGVLTAEDFRRMWRESNELHAGGQFGAVTNGSGPIQRQNQDPASQLFEAGQIFSFFDKDGDGRLNKHEFENLIQAYPDLLRMGKLPPSSSSSSRGIVIDQSFPLEIISGRLLTHYDETAGVAIPSANVEQHKSLGNTVLPLAESYRTRYERLRTLLTNKLLPRREHLLQLRRQLQNTAAEVTATRKGIERETATDTEQIIERLRAAESMRQSAIMHQVVTMDWTETVYDYFDAYTYYMQVLQIEEELDGIERLVRRVESSNDDSATYTGTGVQLSSAIPGKSPISALRSPRVSSMVELVQQFGDLAAQIDRQATKPLTIQVDFPVDDFPRETAERLEVITRCDRYIHALAVKDHMLWTALQEKKRVEEQLDEERRLSHEYANEVASWAEMTHQLSQQMQALRSDYDVLDRRNKELVEILRRHNLHYVVNPGTM